LRVNLDVFEHKFPRSGRGSQYNIYLLSDIHAGSKHIQDAELHATIADIRRDDFARWVGLGDLGDWIAYSDRRFEHYEMADWLDIADPWMSTLEYLVDKLRPIKDKCLGLVRGNHELVAHQRYHFSAHKHLCAMLGALNLGDAAFMRLKFQRSASSDRRENVMYLTHGWGGGRTAGSRANKIEQLMRDFEADIYSFGHVHGQQVMVRSTRTQVNRDIDVAEARVRYGATSGTFLTMAEYEQRNGYAASAVGSTRIQLRPFDSREARRIQVVC